MQTYSVLLEFARKFASQARVTTDREVARELCRMAIEYQDKAAQRRVPRVPLCHWVASPMRRGPFHSRHC